MILPIEKVLMAGLHAVCSDNSFHFTFVNGDNVDPGQDVPEPDRALLIKAKQLLISIRHRGDRCRTARDIFNEGLKNFRVHTNLGANQAEVQYRQYLKDIINEITGFGEEVTTDKTQGSVKTSPTQRSDDTQTANPNSSKKQPVSIFAALQEKAKDFDSAADKIRDCFKGEDPYAQKTCNGNLTELRELLFGGPSRARVRPGMIVSRRYANFDLASYHTYGDIYKYAKTVSRENSSFCRYMSLGKTTENREIPLMKKEPKKVVVVDAGIHGREWIAPSSALYLIAELCRNPEDQRLLREIDLFIILILYLDGYEHSRLFDRLWRKNMAAPADPRNPSTKGVDLNRNFKTQWGDGDSPNDPDFEAYRGPHPESEPKSASLAQFLRDHQPCTKAYVSLHCYAQQVLVPEKSEELMAVAERVANAMTDCRGAHYEAKGPSVEEEIGGTSDRYALNIGIPLADTLEFASEEDDEREFVLPTSEIVPVGLEATAGVLEISHFVAAL